MSEAPLPENAKPQIPVPFRDLPPHRQKRIRRSLYGGTLLFLALIVAFVAGFYVFTAHKKKQAAAVWQPPGIPVRVIDLRPGELDEVMEATGIIQAHREVTVYPEVSGKVVRVDADLGDTVAENAPLLTIDDELIRLKVRQIQAQLTKINALCRNAEKNLKRKEKLFRRKTVSETDYDQSVLAVQTNQGMLEEARAALDMARYELRHTTVRSPIPGKVTARFLEVGSRASPQIPVARVVNLDRVKVEIGLNDEEIRRVRVGQKARLTVDAFPDKELMGEVTAVGSQADANTLTFPVRVERVNSEPDDPLLPGMIARVSITVKEHRDVLVVPREIIHDEGGRLTAFVVEENRARKRRLTLGADEKGMVIVSEGLAPGDRVVCVGHQMLDEGIAVQIDEGDRSTGTSQEPQSLQEPPTP